MSSNFCFAGRLVQSVSKLTENSAEYDVDASFAVTRAVFEGFDNFGSRCIGSFNDVAHIAVLQLR